MSRRPRVARVVLGIIRVPADPGEGPGEACHTAQGLRRLRRHAIHPDQVGMRGQGHACLALAGMAVQLGLDRFLPDFAVLLRIIPAEQVNGVGFLLP